MKTLRPLCIVLVLGLCATRAATGMEMNPLASRDAIVGTVKAVSAGEATNGNPAKVTVEITETLKGQLKGTVVVDWMGPWHGIDYVPAPKGVLEDWAATPAAKPKIGDAYIVFGILGSPMDKGAKESQWLYASPGGRMPLTAENREKALEAIDYHNARVKAELEREAVVAARHAAAVREWRAKMTDEKLAAAIKEADFVAIGNWGLSVTEVLKGRKRTAYTDGSYYVKFKMAREVYDLLDRQSEYVLLLSEKGLVLSAGPPIYRPIGEGVVLADAAAIKLARDLTKGLANKGPPAVFLCPDEPALADALEATACGKVTVIRGRGFGALRWDKISATTGLQADFLLRIYRSFGQPRETVKLELTKTDAAQVFLLDKTFTDPDEKTLAAQAPEIIAAILKANR